jgi:dephospho-CoA kinase
MIVIGLTGGPGTGKSLAASYLKKHGAVILSGDDAGRKAVEEYPSVLGNLVKAFGERILNPDGSLNRRNMGSIAFADSEAHQKLNAIVHPRLLKILKSDLQKCLASKSMRLVVIDAALIFEWAIADWCDYILVVTAHRDIRLKRMIAQGLTRRQSEDRIRAQIPDRQKAALADYVIENNGTKAKLRKKVNRFLRVIPG